MSIRVVSQSAPQISLDREVLKELNKPTPFRLLTQTLGEWLAIALLVLAAVHAGSIAADVVCMVLIATRQHALLVLMHEYSHYQFSRRRLWLNDLVGDVFTAFPFFITIHGFRRDHFQHHRHVSTDQDPNWVSSLKKERYYFPKAHHQVLMEILKYCVGWYTLAEIKTFTVDAGMAVNLPRMTRIARVVFVVAVLWLVAVFNLWSVVLWFWLVPLATFLMAILYVRDLGEHFGLPSPGVAATRTVFANWFDKLFVSPNAVNFHTEHHLFPSVSCFRLKRLHRILMDQPEYRKRVVITRGYFTGLIRELTATSAR